MITNKNQFLTNRKESLVIKNQELVSEGENLTDKNQNLPGEDLNLANENQNIVSENASLLNVNQTVCEQHSKILESVNNVERLTNAICVKLKGKKLRRWLRVFDVGVLIRHSNFTGKLKIVLKIVLRCVGIRKYGFHFTTSVPTEFFDIHLQGINANIVNIMNAEILSGEDSTKSAAESAEQDFILYKKARNEKYALKSSNIGVSCKKGLVSIVLPVYNGGALLAESVESVLAQTYNDFELIIVNDGSTDETPRVIEEYASKDLRIRVINQDNQKLPRALNNGFYEAQGEYFTWTSADNNMHSDFIEKLVAELENDADIDMVYANMNLIDENGDYLSGFAFYSHPQIPYAMMYPHSTTTLNLGVNNSVGAAFMYRASAAHAIGGYSSNRYTTEDLDYWMRVNELFELRHASFEKPIYDYRLHSQSLTAKGEELQIARCALELAAWDKFRRCFLLRPLKWRLHGFEANNSLHIQFINAMMLAGHTILESEGDYSNLCSHDDAYIVYFDMNGSGGKFTPVGNCYTVHMNAELIVETKRDWHCLVGGSVQKADDDIAGFKCWYRFTNGKDMFRFLDIRAKSHFLQEMEISVFEGEDV